MKMTQQEIQCQGMLDGVYNLSYNFHYMALDMNVYCRQEFNPI